MSRSAKSMYLKRLLRERVSESPNKISRNESSTENSFDVSDNIQPNVCRKECREMPTATNYDRNMSFNESTGLIKDLGSKQFQDSDSDLQELPEFQTSENDSESGTDDIREPSSEQSIGSNPESNHVLDDPRAKLREWAITQKVTHKQLDTLLPILRSRFPELPLNSRTLL